MKKILAFALALLMLLATVSCGDASTLVMGTGGTAGTYYGYGGILGTQIKNNAGITVNVVSTDGSKANILGIDAGNYQLGTVQSDVMAYAWAGSRSFESDGAVKSFRVVGGLYAEAVQLVTVNPNIKTVADLAGKKVSIGASGSGVYFNAMDVLTAAGIADSIDPQYQSFADSADALKDGKIDAAFIVAGPPTPAITELFTTNANAHLVPIDGTIAQTLMTSCPYYTVHTIPANTYSGQTADVLTVTVKATLIVDADVDEDTVYELTKAIFDHIPEITEAHAKGAELSIENATSGMTAPFHAGAAKYFAEKGVTNLTVE